MSDSLRQAEAAEIAGNYAEAQRHAQVALAQARQDGNTAVAAQSHKLLGDVTAHQGQPQAAREHYAAALALCQEIDTSTAEAPVDERRQLRAIEGYTLVAMAEL